MKKSFITLWPGPLKSKKKKKKRRKKKKENNTGTNVDWDWEPSDKHILFFFFLQDIQRAGIFSSYRKKSGGWILSGFFCPTLKPSDHIFSSLQAYH